jgi:50S ribosomal subunit-associated GTPase HflX
MDDIIRMAREAGLRSAVLLHAWGKEDALCDSEIEELRQIERFAALVAAPLQERIQDLYKQLDEAERELDSQYRLGMEAEREACAKFFEEHWRERWPDEQVAKLSEQGEQHEDRN